MAKLGPKGAVWVTGMARGEETGHGDELLGPGVMLGFALREEGAWSHGMVLAAALGVSSGAGGGGQVAVSWLRGQQWGAERSEQLAGATDRLDVRSEKEHSGGLQGLLGHLAGQSWCQLAGGGAVQQR